MDILPLFPYIMAGMSARIWPTRAESESGKGRGPCWELVLQIGPCRIEPVTQRLFRVRGGNDQPAILVALRRAEGELDGTGEFWWVEAHKVRDLAAEIRLASDTLLRWSRS